MFCGFLDSFQTAVSNLRFSTSMFKVVLSWELKSCLLLLLLFFPHCITVTLFTVQVTDKLFDDINWCIVHSLKAVQVPSVLCRFAWPIILNTK